MNIAARNTASSHLRDLSRIGTTAIILSFVFSFLATVFVGLRFWVRRIKRVGPLLEDWLVLVALVFEWGYVVVVFLMVVDGGVGWPTNELTPDTLVRSSKYSLAGQTIWPIANGTIKVSICLTLIRIFFTRTFRYVATVVYSLCIVRIVASILVGYLICTPLSHLWTQSKAGHCGNTTAAYVTMGVLDVILDILILLLPMPSLYKLQMPLHRKIAVVATFALGLFTIVASVMRLVAVIDIDFTSKNFNQSQVSDIYWCAIENSVGIIVACAMLLRPLLDRIHDVFGRYRSRWLEMKASRRRATNEGSTGNLVKTADEDSFMRLHDSQELVIATILEGKGDVRDDYTRRASYENV